MPAHVRTSPTAKGHHGDQESLGPLKKETAPPAGMALAWGGRDKK